MDDPELDEFERHMQKLGYTPQDPQDRYINWQELCVCGHLKIYHGQQIGGEYGGKDYEFGVTSIGCVGASKTRSTPPATKDKYGRYVEYPTCPCPKYRGVAEIDRPGRYFTQQVYTKDKMHPMMRGIQAQRTRLRNSKSYGGDDGTWRQQAEKRFKWIKGKRKCRVCGSTGDDVWPSYVNDDRLSQLRCDEHREFPTAEAP